LLIQFQHATYFKHLLKGNNNVNMTLAFMFPSPNGIFSCTLRKICNLNGAIANICQRKFL